MVGRLPDCDLVIDSDPAVSRQHCLVEFNPPTCLLVNTSTYGTLVNGQPVAEARLADGDEITIGNGTTLSVSFHQEQVEEAGLVPPVPVIDSDEPDEPAEPPPPEPAADDPVEPRSPATAEPVAAGDTEATPPADVAPPATGVVTSEEAESHPPEPAFCRVTVVGGPLKDTLTDLPDGTSWVVGRLPECDLCIDSDATVSRRHCQVDWLPPNCFLTNTSTFGTLVNGQAVDETTLADGDEVAVGTDTLIRISLGPAPFIDAAPITPLVVPDPPDDDLEPEWFLDVIEGPARGHQVGLAVGQDTTIGGAAGDPVFADDRSLSKEHIRVEFDGVTCRVIDLQSTYGTFLNGENIAEAILKDGDQLTAGATIFGVRHVPVEESARPSIRCDVLACPSGLGLYRGSLAETSAAVVIDRLCEASSVFAVVDPARVGSPIPDDLLAGGTRLVPDPSAEPVSSDPVLLPLAADDDQLMALVLEWWGNDGLVVLAGRLECDVLATHLGEQARNGTPAGGGRYSWAAPSALSERLANGTENTDPGFMGPLDAVLIELPEGQRWALFVTEKSEAGLASLGFLPG